MKVALTGATGFIGSHVLTDLQEHGHEVIALVRGQTQAETVRARGATAVAVDLYDSGAVASALRGADGAVPGSEDEALARLGDGFAGVLLIDQSASASKVRTELGWRPSHPRLVDDFRDGSYRT
jgi:uncharacterized protein YbjT (DUF2867 family)